MEKYSDKMLIDIEIQLYFNIHHQRPDKAIRVKIQNGIIFNTSTDKQDSLQSLKSYFYQKHARWPTIGEYSSLLVKLHDEVMAQKAP